MTLGSGIVIRLLTFVLMLGAAFSAQAEDCSDYPGGVIDGLAGTPAPAQLPDGTHPHDVPPTRAAKRLVADVDIGGVRDDARRWQRFCGWHVGWLWR